MSRKIRPTPSDSARPTLCIPLKAFIGGGASRNSIARNTQVRIRAVLHTDANLVLDFRVEDWRSLEILPFLRSVDRVLFRKYAV